jgi:hypothetical protein
VHYVDFEGGRGKGVERGVPTKEGEPSESHYIPTGGDGGRGPKAGQAERHSALWVKSRGAGMGEGGMAVALKAME